MLLINCIVWLQNIQGVHDLSWTVLYIEIPFKCVLCLCLCEALGPPKATVNLPKTSQSPSDRKLLLCLSGQ